MPEIYNLTNTTTADNLFEVVKAANELSSSGIAVVILLTTYFITFFNFKRFGGSRAFTASSFITFIISVLLVIMGFISVEYAFMLIIMTAFGVVWMIIFG